MIDDEPSEVEKELEKLLEEQPTEDDLYFRLGGYDGAKFASPGDQIARGKRILRNTVSRSREAICTSEGVKAFANHPATQRKYLAVAASIDFLGAKGAATASVLIVNSGLDIFCAEYWREKQT